MIFSVYMQVGELERSLSFYRDALGMEVAWSDDVLAVLRGPAESAATLVIREVSGGARPGLGEAMVARIGWQVASSADLDSAAERLAQHDVHYERLDETEGKRITTYDPDGLRVVLFLPSDPSLARKPPPFIYWYH
jgi:catechol 2,3-dioxygenase-like lactoylglutathione lyase family enzyme